MENVDGADGPYHELEAVVDNMNGRIITPLTRDPDIFESDFNLDDIECYFNPWIGDHIKLIVTASKPSKVIRMEPSEELRSCTGTVTYLTKSFGTVDGDTVFFMDKTEHNFKKKNQVQYTIIDGKYKVGHHIYFTRCESIKKIEEEEPSEDIKRWFNLESNEHEHETEENADSEIAAPTEPQMKFEALRDREPNEEFYDLPYGLYETLSYKPLENVANIHKCLKKFVPKELNYKTYKTRFHAAIHLEEVEMKISFEKYKARDICIEPENRRFTIMCSKITELRPPIAVGDKIEVRKQMHPNYFYRGVVERVLYDRFILKFKKDFVQDFRMGELYFAEFFHSRVVFMRKHAAIEYAKQKLSESFLFPKKLTLAKNLQLNVVVNDRKLMIDGAETPWFKDLNDEQQEAVAAALRGECRPYPFIIFGPPGTGKTTALIEYIIQVNTLMPNSKILIATQSNHAANIVASRLVACKEEIGSEMIRLVSNSVLDRKSLPQELHKYSASVLHAYAYQGDDVDDEIQYEDIPKNVRRNCRLDYLKNFKIIIGTCVGLGIIFNSEFSEKYFTHIIIDEAAQCSESEAMIPISCINLEAGQVVMAGDPLQLPPISLSNHAKHYNLVGSMLERYIATYKCMDDIETSDENEFDPRLVVRLRRNYRALPSILSYYNKQFYNSALIPTICGQTSVESKQLQNLSRLLPHCSAKDGNEPFGITFVNIEGRNERLENKKSWENKEEATIVQSFLRRITQHGIKQSDIGVITPYHSQVLALKRILKDPMKQVRVGTVEEFQGEEKMVIVFSAVKTSGQGKALQFIYCSKRLNTAISRARMLVVIFGKADLLKGDENWNALIEYCQENKAFIEGKEIVQIL